MVSVKKQVEKDLGFLVYSKKAGVTYRNFNTSNTAIPVRDWLKQFGKGSYKLN